ncbi:hypothetical protein LTR94_033414, partial [Friedmanniomyces endolithicus]
MSSRLSVRGAKGNTPAAVRTSPRSWNDVSLLFHRHGGKDMDEFEVAPPESFDSRQALTRMLALLRHLIDMIAEFRETLILTSGGDPADP